MLIACNWVLVLIQKKPGAFIAKTPSLSIQNDETE